MDLTEEQKDYIKNNVAKVANLNELTQKCFRDDDLDGRVQQLPNRDEVSIDIQEQLVVELCSK